MQVVTEKKTCETKKKLCHCQVTPRTVGVFTEGTPIGLLGFPRYCELLTVTTVADGNIGDAVGAVRFFLVDWESSLVGVHVSGEDNVHLWE